MIVIHIYLKPGTIRMTDIWIYTVHREHVPGNKVITEESKLNNMETKPWWYRLNPCILPWLRLEIHLSFPGSYLSQYILIKLICVRSLTCKPWECLRVCSWGHLPPGMLSLVLFFIHPSKKEMKKITFNFRSRMISKGKI